MLKLAHYHYYQSTYAAAYCEELPKNGPLWLSDSSHWVGAKKYAALDPKYGKYQNNSRTIVAEKKRYFPQNQVDWERWS